MAKAIPARSVSSGGSGGDTPRLATSGGGGAKRQSARLPRRNDRLLSWLALLACLAVAAVPLLVGLDRAGPAVHGEARAVAQSAETWRKQAELVHEGWSMDVLVPWYRGQQQLESAPGTTWLQTLAFTGLSPGSASATMLLDRARLTSVVMALLAVAAVYWIGFSAGGLTTAVLAALVCLANPLFLFFGRLGSAEMPHVGLVLASIAAAVWAIRPLKPAASLPRQAIGWGLCGLLLGIATLTGGLVDTVAVVLPLLMILVLYPHRLSHLLGLVAAVLIAALLAAPWAAYVHGQNPDVWRSWLAAVWPGPMLHDPAAMGTRAGIRLGVIFAAMLPWTALLIAALLQPFSTSSAGSRLRMFLGWVWFVPLTLALLLAPRPGLMAEVLLVLPAGALLVGQVTRQYVDLAAEGRDARIWRLLRWPHALTLLAVSLLLPAAAYFQDDLVRWHWLDQRMLAVMGPGYWAAMAAAMAAAAALSMRFMVRRYPGRVVACWAVWTVLAFVAVDVALSQGPLMHTAAAREGERIHGITGGARLHILKAAVLAESGLAGVPPALVLYAEQPPLPLAADRPGANGSAASDENMVYVLASAGGRPAGDVSLAVPLPETPFTLYRMSVPATTQPSVTAATIAATQP